MLKKTSYLLIEITFEKAGNRNYTLSSLLSLLCGDGFDFQLLGYRDFDGLFGATYSTIHAMDAFFVNKFHPNYHNIKHPKHPNPFDK